MVFLRTILSFFQRGNSIRRKVVGAHIALLLAFLCSDWFDRLFAKTETVFIVTPVSTAVVNESSPKPAPQRPIEPQRPKTPTPKTPPTRVKPKTPKPKPTQKTVKTPKTKSPTKTTKPKRKVRSVEDIRRDMTKSPRKQRPKVDLDRIFNETSIDTKSMQRRFEKAVGSVKVKQSRSTTRTSKYNFSSYHSQIYSELFDSWNQPNMNGQLEVTVELVIAKSGAIISKRITRKSRNSLMDSSVQSMLNRLTALPPFPRTCTESQHKVSVTFGLGN